MEPRMAEKKDEELLDQAKTSFEQATDAFEKNQNRYEDDIRFARMGEQWGSTDVEERKNQGRPSLTVNRMPSFIRQVVNDARQNKPSIKVHPFDDQADPETAEILNGIIRNIEQVSKADLAYDTAIDCAASGGFGYIRVDLDYADDDTFDMDIRINRVLNPLTIYPDAGSTSADSSDWNYCFVTEMMPTEEFEQKYPNAEVIDWSPGGTVNDQDQAWYNTDEVRIAEYWVREEIDSTIYLMSSGDVVSEETFEALAEEYAAAGIELLNTRDTTSHKVTQYIINGQEVLETNEWPGKYIPIIPVYGEEVYIEGERHFFSLIHFAKDAQIMYNYWRTTTTELVAMAPKTPWIGPAGSFDTDLSRWQNANTETYSYLEYDGDVPPQRQPFAGPPAGALQEALNASDDMKSVMGLHDAALGAQSNEISGVAIGKRVREGDTSTFHFVDNMARAIRHTGIIIVDLIPMIYSKPRIMRVLGEDGSAQTVAVNQQLTKEQEMLQGEQIEQQEGMDNIYDLTVGKYDVTVNAGPSYTTQREEARNSMIALLQAFPQAAAVTGDLVANAMDWPNADVFAKRLKSLLPPGVIDDEQDPRIGQMTQQMQGMEQVINQLMADREGKQAEIQVDREKLAVDSRKVDIDVMNAETNRMEAEIKNKEADIKAAVAMKEKAPDNTAIVVKQMDNETKNVEIAQKGQIEADRMNIEEQKLELEKQKFALEQFKAQSEANQDLAEIGAYTKTEMIITDEE
tara:strand:+ start:71 stop:2296 length:2226 start_codon:yes stop_codon:yes gene_type:complete